jgi:hypothetical protein
VKDFIVLPFEKADGSFLTAVCQCPSFVTAGFPDGFVLNRRWPRCLRGSSVRALAIGRLTSSYRRIAAR